MDIKFDNLILQAFAVVLGFLLWVHVATERTYDHELALPLNEIGLDDSLTLAQEPPDSVRIVVSASGKRLLRQKWQRQGLRLTAAQFAPGRHIINLTGGNLSFIEQEVGLTIDKVVAPATVVLNIDDIDSAIVPVEPGLTAEAAEGYTVTGIVVDSPAAVTVIGARARVNQLQSVLTQDRDLTGLDHTDTIKVPIRQPSIYNVEVRPDTAFVVVTVVAIAIKRFEDIPVVVFNRPADEAVDVIPDRIWVELVGPPGDIERLDVSDLSASVDFSGIDSTAKLPLNVDFPAGLTMRDVSVNQIRVVVR